jgi:hypothetical protein
MAEFEKYIARRINKDDAPDSIYPNGDRKFLPGDLLDALNCRIIDGRVKSVKGTEIAYFALPAGTNQVLGYVNNEKENSIIYFIYNSIGLNLVLEYSFITEAFTTLLSGSTLSFNRFKPIVGRVLDGNCIYNDYYTRPKKFNLQRARDGEYTAPYSAEELSLAAYPPAVPPTTAFATNALIPGNFVGHSNWQFAFNFVYHGNEESVFSPLSKIALGQSYYDGTNKTNNTINVTVPFPVDFTGIVKVIQIAYRKGNNGNYFIFEKIINPTLASYTVAFTNTKASIAVALVKSVKISDYISDKVRALEIIDNRVFMTVNEQGQDPATDSFSLHLSVVNGGHASVPAEQYFKDRGTYGVGIVCYDGFNRATFVRAEKYFAIDGTDEYEKTYNDDDELTAIGIVPTFKPVLHWQLTGTAPADMVRYQVVLSKNSNQSIYFQGMGISYIYIRDIYEGETDNKWRLADYGLFNWAGKQYADPRIIAAGTLRQNKARWFMQIPLNSPYVPEQGDFVRILKTEDNGEKTLFIHAVYGDLLDLGPLTATQITQKDTFKDHYMIEVFKGGAGVSEVFYEIGEVFNVTSPGLGFEVTSGYINGDTYRVQIGSADGDDFPKYEYNFPPVLQGYEGGADDVAPPQGQEYLKDVTQVIEAPTTLTRMVSTTLEVKPVGGVVDSATALTLRRITAFTLDYSKIDWNWGRVNTINANEKKIDLATTIIFSDRYVQDSQVNGLSSFDALNAYPLPVDRGPVVSLKRAGNVLLAIHQTETTSVYVGVGFIRQGADLILTKTDSVIGDTEKLQGGYGTINPESVYSFDDHVFFWDATRGAIVKYTKAGLDAISRFGMDRYFYEKGIRMFPYRDNVRVNMTYDYANKELIVCFQDVYNDLNVLVEPAETWAFNPRENTWTNRYSYAPEMIGSLNLNLFSFVGGVLWIHNRNVLHNNFYGVQYKRSWKFACNPMLGKNKRYLNIHIDGHICSEDNQNQAFNPVVLGTKEGQASFIPAYEFQLEQGKWVGPILKDTNTPGVPDTQLPLLSGDDLSSNYVEVEIINDRTDEAPCGQVNVVFIGQEFSK